jgi:hypothetical protein
VLKKERHSVLRTADEELGLRLARVMDDGKWFSCYLMGLAELSGRIVINGGSKDGPGLVNSVRRKYQHGNTYFILTVRVFHKNEKFSHSPCHFMVPQIPLERNHP